MTSNVLVGYGTREFATILVRYWKAIASLCPDAFADPKDFVIQKTAGIHVFHRLLPQVVNLVGHNGRLTQERMAEVLQNLEEGITEEYWSSSGTAGMLGGSKKAVGILVSELSRALENSAVNRAPAQPFAL